MDFLMLKKLISNIDNPAIIFSRKGDIVCKNKQFEHVYEYLDVDELESLNQVKITKTNTDNPDVKFFNLTETHLNGVEFIIRFSEEEKYSLYVFERTFILDELISNVIEHIDEIVVVFDENGILRKMNGICDELLPFKREDVLGKNILELVKDGKVENPVITEMIEKKKKVYRDIVYSDGRVISYTAVPIIDKDGIFKGGVLTGRDVSRLINLARKVNTQEHDVKEYISESPQLKRIKSIIDRVAPSDAPVFIVGESGVGKEIIANSIWNQSNRRDKNFVAINCASIPYDLIESELFGYEKGSFTGAKKDGKIGLIEAADGGTLFLDEIGELPLETQKKLLRVIQENAILRIGAVKPKKVDVRYICATNKTKQELKDPKVFRQDLYYRLNVIPLLIPPLRERKEDILVIGNYYIDLFNKRYNRKIKLTSEAEKILMKNKWEGNVRELKNVIERLVILSPHENIYAEQLERILTLGNIDQIEDKDIDSILGEDIDYNENGNNEVNETEELEGVQGIIVNDIVNIDEAHRIVEQEILKKALEKYGNITNAAKAVGINPSTVYRKIKRGHIKL
ncbi:sigma-54 interaction domain-containing protein [Peptostreptococcus canis]|uniref:Sigma 54-interacting transcriptional regulator n=1 Tax=Peptostreptococcus canis TaxID=1159213 RepID=A0ABR6TI80_9FIRM|nr:sigma 54-interacting transcriptional regulator [Peptostreptococcus canis]MBC2575097.1 sigma 54-interacting transcriptional regulator [Peptostreptococcus canis]MBP1997729.1 PAS domain S-box-containing protein [Peptostreptococcus canis]